MNREYTPRNYSSNDEYEDRTPRTSWSGHEPEDDLDIPDFLKSKPLHISAPHKSGRRPKQDAGGALRHKNRLVAENNHLKKQVEHLTYREEKRKEKIDKLRKIGVKALATVTLSALLYNGIQTLGDWNQEMDFKPNMSISGISLSDSRLRSGPYVSPIDLSSSSDNTYEMEAPHFLGGARAKIDGEVTIDTPHGVDIRGGDTYNYGIITKDGVYTTRQAQRVWYGLDVNDVAAGLAKHNDDGRYTDEIKAVLDDPDSVVWVASDTSEIHREQPNDNGDTSQE